MRVRCLLAACLHSLLPVPALVGSAHAEGPCCALAVVGTAGGYSDIVNLNDAVRHGSTTIPLDFLADASADVKKVLVGGNLPKRITVHMGLPAELNPKLPVLLFLKWKRDSYTMVDLDIPARKDSLGRYKLPSGRQVLRRCS